jgi:GNAT superfamily N-acetyltransferase
MSRPGIEVRPLTADRWADLLTLFGPSGAYSNCWCTWWRQTGSEFGRGCENRGAGNRALLASLTREGRVPGLIAYRDDEPVGWVSVAPRREFGRILRSPTLRPEATDDADTTDGAWAITCFWIPRAERGRGLADTLLRAAVQHAGAHGATQLEAYPIDTDGGSRASAGLFTGTLAMFARDGFTEAFRRSAWQPVVRRPL